MCFEKTGGLQDFVGYIDGELLTVNILQLAMGTIKIKRLPIFKILYFPQQPEDDEMEAIC